MFTKDASTIDNKDQSRSSLRSRVSAFGAALKPVNILSILSLIDVQPQRGAPAHILLSSIDG